MPWIHPSAVNKHHYRHQGVDIVTSTDFSLQRIDDDVHLVTRFPNRHGEVLLVAKAPAKRGVRFHVHDDDDDDDLPLRDEWVYVSQILPSKIQPSARNADDMFLIYQAHFQRLAESEVLAHDERERIVIPSPVGVRRLQFADSPPPPPPPSARHDTDASGPRVDGVEDAVFQPLGHIMDVVWASAAANGLPPSTQHAVALAEAVASVENQLNARGWHRGRQAPKRRFPREWGLARARAPSATGVLNTPTWHAFCFTLYTALSLFVVCFYRDAHQTRVSDVLLCSILLLGTFLLTDNYRGHVYARLSSLPQPWPRGVRDVHRVSVVLVLFSLCCVLVYALLLACGSGGGRIALTVVYAVGGLGAVAYLASLEVDVKPTAVMCEA